MRSIMVMFDTLCRRFLPPYGNEWVIAPNFRRLAARTVQFDRCYVGSMPCMPARREIHTGRYNFLHRSWGPLEPFDDSMPELLREQGIHAHKVTDHYHYWEDGGATYHNRYSSFEFVRGQEGDPYIGFAGTVVPPRNRNPERGRMARQDWINRAHQRREEDQPQHITFTKGIEFIRRNQGEDRWFCQIETFDPHEPFFTQKHYQDLYPHEWDGSVFDWPPYDRVTQTSAESQHMRFAYAALVSMCDRHLGRILDLMDELDLWKDTQLIVNTDHGFLLGEHDWWAKCRMPFYQEVAHIPLWIWDPRHGVRGERRQALVQTIDIAPTVLEFLGLPAPADMQGRALGAVVARDHAVREAALYGIHGGHVNITDGRWVYMRGPVPGGNAPLHQYTLMPTHMTSRFRPQELQAWERHPGFRFTKGCQLMQIPSHGYGWLDIQELETRLYDLEADYDQRSPVDDVAVEDRMIELLIERMRASEAPPCQFQRLGLDRRGSARRAAAAAAASKA